MARRLVCSNRSCRKDGEVDVMFQFEGERYATVEELAEIFGVDVAKVREKVRRNEIPSVPGLIRGCRMIPLSVVGRELQQYVAKKYGSRAQGIRLALSDDELADLAESEFGD